MTMDKSAEVVMVVSSVSLLLLRSESAVLAATLAVLVMVPVVEAFTVTTIVIVDEAPAPRALRVQVTRPLFSTQLQPGPPALPKVTPAGRVSVTIRFRASDMPKL